MTDQELPRLELTNDGRYIHFSCNGCPALFMFYEGQSVEDIVAEQTKHRPYCSRANLPAPTPPPPTAPCGCVRHQKRLLVFCQGPHTRGHGASLRWADLLDVQRRWDELRALEIGG